MESLLLLLVSIGIAGVGFACFGLLCWLVLQVTKAVVGK